MTCARSIHERSEGELGAIADTEGSLQSDTLVGLMRFPLLPHPSSALLPCEALGMFQKLQVTHGADFQQGGGKGTGISCTLMQVCEEGTTSTPE